MRQIVLDADAVIMHGRAFPERVRGRVEHGDRIILPGSVERELVDDVLENDSAPENHRRSARSIAALVEEGSLIVRRRVDTELPEFLLGGLAPDITVVEGDGLVEVGVGLCSSGPLGSDAGLLVSGNPALPVIPQVEGDLDWGMRVILPRLVGVTTHTNKSVGMVE